MLGSIDRSELPLSTEDQIKLFAWMIKQVGGSISIDFFELEEIKKIDPSAVELIQYKDPWRLVIRLHEVTT